MELIIALVLFAILFVAWMVLPGSQASETSHREADGMLTTAPSPSK
jgi:type II secretory pathway component PulJ